MAVIAEELEDELTVMFRDYRDIMRVIESSAGPAVLLQGTIRATQAHTPTGRATSCHQAADYRAAQHNAATKTGSTLTPRGRLKSKRRRSGPTALPCCATLSPSTPRSAACSRCVAVWCARVRRRATASTAAVTWTTGLNNQKAPPQGCGTAQTMCSSLRQQASTSIAPCTAHLCRCGLQNLHLAVHINQISDCLPTFLCF